MHEEGRGGRTAGLEVEKVFGNAAGVHAGYCDACIRQAPIGVGWVDVPTTVVGIGALRACSSAMVGRGVWFAEVALE